MLDLNFGFNTFVVLVYLFMKVCENVAKLICLAIFQIILLIINSTCCELDYTMKFLILEKTVPKMIAIVFYC